MSNIVPMQTPAPLRPRDYDGKQLALIRRTVAADTTADEFDMFMEIAKRAGLDPFRRQLYCVVYNKDKPEKRKVTFITAIDGFRAVAARNGDYRPDDEEPVIVYDNEAKDPKINPLGIVKATVKTYKKHGNEWHAVVGTAHWSEFAPLKEEWAFDEKAGKRKPTGVFELDPNSNWYKMPRVMLPKCAEAQALRKGWPEDLSAIYSPEEMERAMIDITPSEAVEKHAQDQRLRLVGATNAVPIIWKLGEPIEMVPVGQMHDKAAEFISKNEMATELGWWRDTNTAGLREYWALAKADALDVKRLLEERIEALGKA